MTSVNSLASEVVAEDTPRAATPSRVAAVLRVLWCGVVPLLLSALTWRYLVPRPATLGEGTLRDWVEFCDQHQSLIGPGLFLFYSFALRQFRAHLPAAELWSETAAPPPRSSLRSNLLWFVFVLLA